METFDATYKKKKLQKIEISVTHHSQETYRVSFASAPVWLVCLLREELWLWVLTVESGSLVPRRLSAPPPPSPKKTTKNIKYPFVFLPMIHRARLQSPVVREKPEEEVAFRLSSVLSNPQDRSDRRRI